MGNNPRVDEPYDLNPDHTVLLGVDFQQGFGDGAWEHTPDAAAVAKFRSGCGEVARRWRPGIFWRSSPSTSGTPWSWVG